MVGQYASLGALMPESGLICVCWLTSLVLDELLLKKKGCCCSLLDIVRRAREGFQYSAVILYCVAVGVRASRVVTAARGV